MHQTIFISLPIEDFQNVLIDCVNTCLRNNQQEQSEHIKNDRWMDINELCQYHPDKPTKATVYGWVNARTIPVHKGGKKLRFLVSEIDEWLLSNRLQSQAEMVNEAGKYLVNKNGGKR
jgi:predicted DNA-binding transcriptional regulator AlpA